MKSYWIVTRGNESQLERREIPVPEPKAGEVVVKVHATALNRGELVVGGAVHGGPEKLGGTEAAGVIAALGSGVSGWKVGDRVMGRARGGFAEFAVVYSGQLMPVPAEMAWEEAAAVPSSFLTAYEAVVQHGALQRGEWLLVAGAAAGCGVPAMQIARVLGASTVGTSRTLDKSERLRALGFDAIVATGSGGFADRVREITGRSGAHIAINLVGGTVFAEILRSLAYKGRVAIVGYVDGVYDATIDLGRVHLDRHRIFGISNAKVKPEERFATTAGFRRDILPALADGRIVPHVDRVFAFDELPAARAWMEAPQRIGKVVVRLD